LIGNGFHLVDITLLGIELLRVPPRQKEVPRRSIERQDAAICKGMTMKATLALWTWLALLVPVTAVAIGESVAPVQPDRVGITGDLKALEEKLVGQWRGPACGGNYTFSKDSTFKLDSFTPGGNTLTGTWSIRWDELPPTLVLQIKTSDFTKDPNREEFEYLDKDWELKLIELNDKALVYRLPGKGERSSTDKRERRFERHNADEAVGGR
jgi:hypothetical protein